GWFRPTNCVPTISTAPTIRAKATSARQWLSCHQPVHERLGCPLPIFMTKTSTPEWVCVCFHQAMQGSILPLIWDAQTPMLIGFHLIIGRQKAFCILHWEY